jgi:hypothetical protein
MVIDATDNGRIADRSVALNIADEDADTRRAVFATALSAALASHDFTLDPAAPLIADYAIAESAASDGTLGGEPTGANSPQWLSQPRAKKRFDQCKPRRLRATLVLFDRASGAVAYRGSASRIECAFSQGDTIAMADALVKDAAVRLSD